MNIITFIKKRKWTVGIIGVVVILGLVYFFVIKKPAQVETITVQKGDFLQQVSVSGNVKASQNIDLSFEAPGTVTSVKAVVGDKVFAGKFLAGQSTTQLSAQLSEMQANINVQKARLAQLMAGQSPQDIQIAQDKVTSATGDLQNAYQSTMVTLNTAYNSMYNAYTVALYTRNMYFAGADQAGVIVQDAKNSISNYMADAKANLDKASLGNQSDIDVAIVKILADTKSTYDSLKIIRDQCDQDVYYYKVSAVDKTSLDTQKTNINTALTNTTSAQNSVATYKSALTQAKNNLELAKAPIRQTDIAVYQAQITQAEAQEQGVLAQIRNRQIYAPINGTITAVNAKVGMIMGNSPVAISMIGNGSFQIESYLPEIYVALVKIDNDADVTLDSYGSNKVFHAKVVSIDPSETVKDGVSTYKVIMNLDDGVDQVRDGMTANVVITTKKKSDVISIPQGTIVSKDGKQMVKVQIGKDVVEKEVTVGDISSNGQAEIVSGLNAGDLVVIK